MSQTLNEPGLTPVENIATEKKVAVLLEDTIKQSVIISDTLYRFEYGIFEISSDNPNEVAKRFFSKSKTNSDILPPVTRWISKDMSVIAVERPPLSVNIRYEDIHMEEEPEITVRCEDCDPDYGCDCGYESDNMEYLSYEYSLNIPWTVWFFDLGHDSPENQHITEAHVFCSPNSIQSSSSALYCLPLPNIYDNQNVCWGSGLPWRKLYPNFSAYVLGSINNFWTSQFNNDLTSNIGSLDLGTYTHTKEYLEAYSKLSMDEVLSANFLQYSTFGAYCEDINKRNLSRHAISDNSNKASKFFKEIGSV